MPSISDCPLASVLFVIVLCATSVFEDAAAQKASTPPQISIFAAEDMLPVMLFADFDVLFADRGDSPSEHPASLVYIEDSSVHIEPPAQIAEIQVRVRGNFRKNKNHCNFPPLRLNFKKKAVRETVFAGLDKVKLVTHCQDWEQAYNERVILEYLAYKIYNVITPYSFNVRLLELTYAKGKDDEDRTRFGFLIEDDDDMAARNGGVISKTSLIHQDSTDADQMALLSIFQYLIGNTDWSVTAQHNIKLVEVPGRAKPIPVPYDFDWSGLVNAPYATPAPNLRMESVRERRYRGYCRPIEELQPHFDVFMAHREEIEAIVDSLDMTSAKYRKQARHYISQFYKDISKARRKKRAFTKFCRKD